MRLRLAFCALLFLAALPCAIAGEAGGKPTPAADGPTLDLGQGQTITLVQIPAGTFTMGTPKDLPMRLKTDIDERPVQIYKPFWMGTTEITQAQYEAVMGDNPSDPAKGGVNAKDGIIREPQHPVVLTTIVMAEEFCAKVAKLTRRKVRLPSRDEWEYAARAGGDGLNGATLDEVAWYTGNSGKKLHPVGQKRPNAWGLFDMIGNVGEWTSNAHLAGGNWFSRLEFARATLSEPHGGTHADPWSGFRVLVEVPASAASAEGLVSKRADDPAEAIVVGPETMIGIKGGGANLNGTIVDDPASPSGKALHFRNDTSSSVGLGALALKPGRYRFTVSARHEAGRKFKLRLRVGGATYDQDYTFFFGAAGDTNEYRQQSVDWVVPGKGAGFLQGAKYQTGEMIERIVITPLPATTLLEVLDVETDKLVYRPGEVPRVTIQLRNSAAVAAKPTLRLVAASGIADETVVAEQAVELPASSKAVPVELPLPAALPAWGSLLRAELLVDGAVVAANRTACAVSEEPFRVGQYGIIAGDDRYEATGIGPAIDQFRRTYCTVVETAFWAPCDMSLLTPPAGKDRWWSGQTYRKVSREQIRTYADRLHAQGMAFLGYATYTNVFSHRVFDWGRSFPEALDWGAKAEDKFIWWGIGQDRLRLDAPARSEDDSQTGLEPKGVARTMHTQPIALQRHADQLVAAMQEFGLDGFRYDDNLDYAGDQVDILGRRGPFPGWGLDEVFTYFRQRLHAANPKAIFGHNSDPMRTGGDAMYSKMLDHPEAVDEMEAAIFRDGSLGLQEAFTKAPGGKATWVQWRDRNELAGRSAHRNGGVLASITGFGGEPQSMTAMMLAAGNRVAYSANDAHRPYLAYATRYSELLYNAQLRWLSQDDARKTVSVAAPGREVWWTPWVRFLPTAPGKRVYLVHLINPPTGETFAESGLPEPVKDIALTLHLPQGWTAQRAWHLTADHGDLSGELVRSRVVNGKAQAEGSARTAVSYASGYPGATPLPLQGQGLTLPMLDCWSLVAIACAGPANDTTPSDLKPARPAPTVPALAQPAAPERATELELYANRWQAGWQVVKPGTPLTLDLQSNHGPFDYNPLWPAGRYQVTVEYQAASPTGKLSLAITSKKRGAGKSKAGGEMPALPASEAKAEWTLAAPAAGKPGLLSAEVTWSDMGGLVPFTFTTDTAEVSITGFRIACLALHDQERLKLWGNGWPASGALRASETGFCHIDGPFGDYFGLRKVLEGIPGTKTDFGYAHMVGQQWGGVNILKSFEDRQLIVLNDVAIWRFTPSRLDQLRGWVEAGGRLVMTGGPYGFGRGGWGLSDLVAPMHPADLQGAFDLQPTGAGGATLVAESAVAKEIDFAKAPLAMWQHRMQPRAGAIVHVSAGGQPAIITRPYGKGKVCYIALAPLGEAPAGKTAFWAWDMWPDLMKAMVEDLRR
jgi:hypothetical protein